MKARGGAVAFVCACLMAGPAVAQEVQVAQGWRQLFDEAANHDPQLRSARQELGAAEARADQADATRWPQVNLSANTQYADQHLSYDGGVFQDRQDRFNTHGYNLQLTQPLLRLADRAQRAGAQAQVLRQRAEVQASEMALMARVSQAYFEACRFHEVMTAAQAEVARHQALSETLQARVSKGDAAEFESLMAQADLREARAKRLEAFAERAQRLRTLSAWTGRSVVMGTLACGSESAPAVAGEPDAWLDEAMQSSPQIRSGEMAVQAARAQVAQADAGHWFTVDLVASDALSRQGPTAAVDVSSSTHTTSVGVQLNVPIFSGGSVSAKQREAAAQLAKAEADLDATRLQVRSDLGAAWVSLQAAQAHGDAAGLRVQALSAQADALRKRWDRGVAAEADVRAAQQDEAQARADWLRLQGESVQAYVRLLALTGRGLTPRSSPPG